MIVNIFISLLGLLVLIVGIWAKVRGNDYTDVTNNHDLDNVPVLLIVVGLFILLLGIAGTIGAVFAGTVVGRFIIGLYAFVLALLVICEIAGGIAAAAKKNDLADSLQSGLNSSFLQYNKTKSSTDAWDAAQRGFKCCGFNNYTDYAKYLKYPNGTLPWSCCKVGTSDSSSCSVNSGDRYNQGCYNEIRDFFSNNLSVVAGVAISFGFLQIIGVIVSCFVAVAGAKATSGNYQNV